jgi:hypothetical protein
MKFKTFNQSQCSALVGLGNVRAILTVKVEPILRVFLHKEKLCIPSTVSGISISIICNNDETYDIL